MTRLTHLGAAWWQTSAKVEMKLPILKVTSHAIYMDKLRLMSEFLHCDFNFSVTFCQLLIEWMNMADPPGQIRSFSTENIIAGHLRPLLTAPLFCLPYSVFVTMTNTSAATFPATAAAAATLPAATTGPFVRPSRCTMVQGTTHCTCEPGYTISGRDSNICTGTTNTSPVTKPKIQIYGST